MENDNKVYCDDCVYGNSILGSCRKHDYTGDSIGRKDTLNINGDCKYYEAKPWEKIKKEFKQLFERKKKTAPRLWRK